MNEDLHGVSARFATPEAFLDALRRVREAGYSEVEVNVPFNVEGMAEWLPGKPAPMAKIVLIAGLLGMSGGYFLQWYAAHDYPVDVGGRPLNSWPAFIPVTFELTVLTAAIVGVLALLWLAGLPRLHHPVMATPQFERATQDRFFLCVRADDRRFDAGRVRELLRSLEPEEITEVRT